MSNFPDAHTQTPIADRLAVSYTVEQMLYVLLEDAHKQHMAAGPILNHLKNILKIWSAGNASRRADRDTGSGTGTRADTAAAGD